MNNENHVCCYCGKKATHQFKNGKWCCSDNMNRCPKIKKDRSDSSKLSWDNYHKNSNSFCKHKVLRVNDNNLCDYGCGHTALYILKNGKKCCSKSFNQCPAMRLKNSNGVQKAYNEGKLNAKENYQKLPEETKRRMAWSKNLTKETNNSVKIVADKISIGYKSGKIIHALKGKTLSSDVIDKIYQGILKSNKGRRGNYKGYHFDSSWELAFIVYNIDHKIQFKRNMESFNWFNPYDGKFHKYFPDFIVNDTLIEIKAVYDDIAKLKEESVKNNYKRNIEIYQYDKMKLYIDYCINNYGKNFVTILKDK